MQNREGARGWIGIAVAVCVGIMCLVRAGLGAWAYLDPAAVMGTLGASPAENLQMPYVARVWAFRDVVLTALVVHFRTSHVSTLLAACVVIGLADVLSALLAHARSRRSEHDRSGRDLARRARSRGGRAGAPSGRLVAAITGGVVATFIEGDR